MTLNKSINRSDPCPCGSGRKYKKCCLSADERKAGGGDAFGPMIRRFELVCALGLTGLLVFLHAYYARHAGALWRDEVSTLATASMPSFSEMWSSQIYTRPPLLPYVVVRLWTWIGWFASPDMSLRVLGALTGVGVIMALWLDKRLLGGRAPMLSLVLFGLNAAVIPWGDSIRGYGLGTLLILLVYGLIWAVVESPTRVRVVAATLAAVLSVQCVLQTAPLLFAICLGGFLVCARRQLWKRALIVFAAGATAALSLMVYSRIIKAFQGASSVISVPVDFSVISNRIAATLSLGNGRILWAWLICVGLSMLSACALIALNRHERDYEERADLAIYSLTTIIAGAGAYLLFLKKTDSTVFPWHCIPLLGPIALSMDVLIERACPTNTRRISCLALALLTAGLAIPAAWEPLQARQTNADVIASALEERASPGDCIIVNPWFLGVTFQRYYRGKSVWLAIPPQAIPTSGLQRFDLEQAAMAMRNPLQPVFEAMEKSLRSGHRVWLVGDYSFPSPEQRLPELPPVPKGSNGMIAGHYRTVWTLQLGRFIQAHALEGGAVDLKIARRINPFEDVQFNYFKGWH